MISVTRGVVIGLVYDQSLHLDPNAAGANPLAALTHANGDTDAAQQALYQAHDPWSSIVEIVVADYLIWRQMGAACAIPIAVAAGESATPTPWPVHTALTTPFSSCRDRLYFHGRADWFGARRLAAGPPAADS